MGGRCVRLSLLAAGLGLDAGHPFGAAGLGLSLQDFNAPLQLVNHRLLAGNDRKASRLVRSRPVSMFQI